MSKPTGPACGNNPNYRMSDGDRQAVGSFRAYLATLARLRTAAHRLDQIRDAARLHRQQLIGTSELYAVIEADDEEQPPADRAALRRRFGEVLRRWGLLDEVNDPKATEEFAVTDLLAVLPEPVDPAAVLRDAADRYDQLLADMSADTGKDPRYWAGVQHVATGLRRMADETQPADRAALREQFAAAMREHYLSSNRDAADADRNMPCVCGDWREPGAETDDENDWDSHLADAVLAVLPEPAPTTNAPATECSAQHRRFDDGRLCIRAAQHHGDHIDERGYHWSDTVAVYPVSDGTFRRGPDVRTGLRRLADETPDIEEQPTRPDTAPPAPATEPWRGATELATEREIVARAATGLVGYRQGRGTLLHCIAHKPAPASRWADFHEVTAEDLDDGGICVHPRCGRDLLAPWPAAGARQDGEVV